MTPMDELKKNDNLLSKEYPSIKKYSSCIVLAIKNETHSVILLLSRKSKFSFDVEKTFS